MYNIYPFPSHLYTFLKALLYTFLSSPLNIWPLFFTNYYFILYVEYISYIYIYILKCNLLSLYMLLVCMFLGLAICHRTINRCVLPWREPALPLLAV